MRRDGKWTYCGHLSDVRGLKNYYLANITAPWCAVYLRTWELMNSQEEKTGKTSPIQKVGRHLTYIQIQNKNNLLKENDCMHTLAPVR